MKKYSVWIKIEHWACIDGGEDLVGTKEEMEAKIAEWKQEETYSKMSYEVKEYTTEFKEAKYCQIFDCADLAHWEHPNGLARCTGHLGPPQSLPYLIHIGWKEIKGS